MKYFDEAKFSSDLDLDFDMINCNFDLLSFKVSQEAGMRNGLSSLSNPFQKILILG